MDRLTSRVAVAASYLSNLVNSPLFPSSRWLATALLSDGRGRIAPFRAIAESRASWAGGVHRTEDFTGAIVRAPAESIVYRSAHFPQFEKVTLAGRPPFEQIALFAEASVVAGPHGARLTNLLLPRAV